MMVEKVHRKVVSRYLEEIAVFCIYLIGCQINIRNKDSVESADQLVMNQAPGTCRRRAASSSEFERDLAALDIILHFWVFSLLCLSQNFQRVSPGSHLWRLASSVQNLQVFLCFSTWTFRAKRQTTIVVIFVSLFWKLLISGPKNAPEIDINFVQILCNHLSIYSSGIFW